MSHGPIITKVLGIHSIFISLGLGRDERSGKESTLEVRKHIHRDGSTLLYAALSNCVSVCNHLLEVLAAIRNKGVNEDATTVQAEMEGGVLHVLGGLYWMGMCVSKNRICSVATISSNEVSTPMMKIDFSQRRFDD